jgi:PilZ domain-containing protein
MARMSDKERTDLAVSVLSQLASNRVEALSGDGGVVMLELHSQDGVYIVAEAPKQRVRPRLDLLVRTNDAGGGGYDIATTVAEVTHETQWTVRMLLGVLDLQQRQSHRVTQRAAVEEPALLHVLSSRSIAGGEEFDVWLADLSPAGVAFITDQTFHAGDRVTVMVTIEGRVLRLQARVLQTSSSHYGRQRVGGEILQITDDDRRRIAELTTEQPHTGTPEQRLRTTG